MSRTNLSYFANATDPFDIDALMDFHRARFGGFSMVEGGGEEAPAEVVEEKPAETVEEKPSEEKPAEEKPKEEESKEESKLSHEDALSALAKARSEAAAARVKNRETEQKFADAKTPEEVKAIVRDLTLENVALAHKLPADLASALKGETREELEAHAKVLAKYVPVVAAEEPEGSGGLDPEGGSDGAFDPVAEARKARRRR